MLLFIYFKFSLGKCTSVYKRKLKSIWFQDSIQHLLAQSPVCYNFGFFTYVKQNYLKQREQKYKVIKTK